MDYLLKLYESYKDEAFKAFDLFISGQDKFINLPDDVQTEVKVFCITFLVMYRWFRLCEKVNK